MSILWAGGEDIDFNGTGSIAVSTDAAHFRSGYARCAVSSASQIKSTLFAGGGVTSCWLSFRFYLFTNTKNGRLIGLVNSATVGSGLWIGTSSADQTKIALHKFDGTTQTQLAAESGNSLGVGLYRVDVQLANYGSSSTVNVYVGGTLVISYSGSTAISGVASLDCVGLYFFDGTNSCGASEIIVADESTLELQGVVTYAPNGDGATQNFSNPAYTNFNPLAINDANSTYTNSTGQDEQATLPSAPAGTSFQVKAVRIAARAMVTAEATPTGIKLGFNNTNTSVVAEGAAHTLGAGFATVEDIFNTDPTSSGGTGDWGADLSGYQLEIKSS